MIVATLLATAVDTLNMRMIGTESTPWYASLLTALLGGVAGIVLTLSTSFITSRWGRWRLKLTPEQRIMSGASFLVHNKASMSLTSAIAHVSIQHTQSDIEDGDGKSWMTPETEVPLKEGALCWDMIIEGRNKPSIDVFPHQRHGLTFIRFEKENLPIEKRTIRIASETGIGDQDDQKFRVRLKWKSYCGLIKIVSKDSQPKHWLIMIAPNDPKYPLKVVDEISRAKYEQLLQDYSTPWCDLETNNRANANT